MRVLMLVQQMDERDWLRAFIVTWVRALAAHVDQLDVLTLENHGAAVPDNVRVYSMGKEQGKNRAREALNFHRHMTRLAPQADVIFSHMTPRYTWLAAPYAALFKKRQVLWFTHRYASPHLRLALAASWRITTATPESFPLASSKVRALGHGIDTDFYAPGDTTSVQSDPFYVVHVARLMPIKHQATLIRALAQVPQAHAVFVGDVPEGQETHAAYGQGLKQLAVDLGVADRITFTGGLLAPGVRDWYRRAAVAVNLSPPGLFDKAVLESIATGTPTIVSSHAFDSLLGPEAPQVRLDSPDDVDGLASRLQQLQAQSPDERRAITLAQRERVIAAHSLERLMTRLVKVFATGEPEP